LLTHGLRDKAVVSEDKTCATPAFSSFSRSVMMASYSGMPASSSTASSWQNSRRGKATARWATGLFKEKEAAAGRRMVTPGRITNW